nr:integrase, catalytic region, zinc finger, CCHC-type, peptidase aspartic, catalytic [Tanacetum cinerariifolium]
MANLSDSEDIQCAGFDHDYFQEATCAHHEEHVMHDCVQLDHVIDSHDDYTSDSNIILCDQYIRGNEVPVIHSGASSVPIDAFMMIYDDMCEPHVQSDSYPSRNTVVKNSLTAELAIYKEHVELYEQRAKFELTEREQKINEQLRIVISDHNFMEETLKRDLHSIKLQLALTIKHNKSMVEDKLIKQDQSLQTVHMLCKPRPNSNELKRVAIGYKNPLCLTRAKQAQPALYNGHEILKDNHAWAKVHNSEDTLEIAEITRKKINAKMTDPECVTHKIKFEALKERTKVSRPLKAFTVYPPNTPAALVPKVLPTKIQVKILIFTLIQLFLEFDQTCKKRITPSAITDWERGFEQIKACYLQEVIPFFKTLKDNFEGIQKALTKEVKEIKDVFEELEAEVAQYSVDRKHDAIDRKNLLIANGNLIAECLSQEVLCVATNSELNVARFTDMHVANTTAETRCLTLEAELANLHQIGNSPPTPNKDTPDFDSVFVIGKMQASLQGKYNVIRQLKKELSQLQVSRRDTDRALRVHTTDSQITKLTDQNNRNAHLDYLRHLKESVETIRDIVEEAKVVRPLDRSIVSACHYTKHSQELLEYVIGTCPQGSQPHAKQLAHIPLIRKKQVIIAQPSNKLDSTTHPYVVTITSQKINVPVPPSTGVDCYPIASRSQPMSHVKPNRISPGKGDTKLPIDDQPRKNKSHLRTSTRIDSSSRLKEVAHQSALVSHKFVTQSMTTASSIANGSLIEGDNKMADVNAPSDQTPTMAPPVRADDQILPHIRWIPIGKSNCYLDLEKSQSNPIYKIVVDILMNTNFFRAFTASSNLPSIYIQQLWDTILYENKARCYKCQLDEQWFDLTKETLREALQITPVNHNQAFAAPPSIDGLIDFVNQLGYPKLVVNLSIVVTNDLFQPWRALLTIINLCLMGKTSGFKRPRAPMLHILWGIVTRTNIDYAERIWEEFTQSIHTFIEDKRNLSRHTSGKKRATLIVLPSIRFTKLIIHHLQRKHRFHPRPDSPFHLSNEEPVLGYLKFSAKDADFQKAVEESMKDAYALPKGPLPPVVIREPESGKYQPLPEVPGKGKAKVSEEQVAHDLLSLQKHKKTSHGSQDKGQAGPDPNAQAEGQTGSDTGAQAEGQAGSNPDETSEGQAGPDPNNAEARVQSTLSLVVYAGSDREHMDLDVANVSPQPSTEKLYEGFTATVYPNVQENLKLVVEEPVLLDEPASSSGTLSSLQHLSRDFRFGDQFFSDKPSNADKSAETEVESMVNVPIQQALSSISLMTSPIVDLTSRPESPKENHQLKATTTDTTTTTTTLDKHGAHLYTLEQLDIPQQVSITISEVVTDAVDWAMQAPLCNRFRDLPEADMKEILHQRMWESDSYKSHEDHMQLFEALEKSINHYHSKELVHDLAEARKKRKKGRESPKMPPRSPSHQPPPPPPPAGPSGTSGAPRAFGSQVTPPPPTPTSTNQDSPSKGSAAPSPIKTAVTTEHQAWSTPDVTLKPLVSLNPEDLDMDEAMEERPSTLEPAWSIQSSDVPVPTNNWASTLASNYSPPPEDLLLTQTGNITTFMDWFCKRRGITELKPQDLEGPAYEIVKVFHPDAIHLQYQIEKCHKLLTDSVDDPILRHNVSKPLPLGGPPGQVTIQSDFFFNKDLEYLRYGSKGRRPALSISKMKAAYYPDAGLEQMVPD